MVAFAVGVTKILAAKGIVPEIAAGLSLGEYSALYAAGVFEEQQVIDLVAYRGKSMEEAVTGRDTGMIAVMNLDCDFQKLLCLFTFHTAANACRKYDCCYHYLRSPIFKFGIAFRSSPSRMPAI